MRDLSSFRVLRIKMREFLVNRGQSEIDLTSRKKTKFSRLSRGAAASRHVSICETAGTTRLVGVHLVRPGQTSLLCRGSRREWVSRFDRGVSIETIGAASLGFLLARCLLRVDNIDRILYDKG